jgi:RNA polymerase subunit RPABC4/transcription elongation factor Spt4
MNRIKKIIDKSYREKIIAIINHLNWLSHTKWAKEKKLLSNIYQDYYNAYGRYPNMNHPMDLNEKLLWLSYYWRHPLKALCADKYKCREYVTKKCGLPEQLIVPLYGVWMNSDDIDFFSLPKCFVLKCNHGCGYNIIVKDKSEIVFNDAKRTLDKWLSENYVGNSSEIHYKDIHPHVIICEKYLEPQNGSISQTDYKLMCINGEPQFFLVASDRDSRGEANLTTFSKEWSQLYYIKNEQKSTIAKPHSIEEMLKYATVLSNEFPFVRVDFYEIDGKPILGEMTFTPYGNIMTYFKDDVLMKYGQKLHLPQKILQ